MGVKVVPFILFALAGECLSLNPHQKQVNDVLFKMSDKLIDIEKKLTSIEERVHVLENSLTKPQENKPTNLEDAMRNLGIGANFYRSFAGEKECEDKQCGDRCGDLNLKTDFYCQRDGSCQPGLGICHRSADADSDSDSDSDFTSGTKSYRSMGGLPDQCTSYKTLTDSSRTLQTGGPGDLQPGETKPDDGHDGNDISGDPKQRPDWKGEGWYRYYPDTAEGYSFRMAFTDEVTKTDICGTEIGGHMVSDSGPGGYPVPDDLGETKEVQAAFGHIGGFKKFVDIKVTNCRGFFVYYLPDAKPGGGYCFVRVPNKFFDDQNEPE